MTNVRHQIWTIVAVIFAIAIFATRRVESRSDRHEIFPSRSSIGCSGDVKTSVAPRIELRRQWLNVHPRLIDAAENRLRAMPDYSLSRCTTPKYQPSNAENTSEAPPQTPTRRVAHYLPCRSFRGAASRRTRPRVRDAYAGAGCLSGAWPLDSGFAPSARPGMSGLQNLTHLHHVP
jgi:hypothetical protein